MPITIPNATSGGNSAASTSLTVTVPGGATVGDIMYVAIVVGNAAGTASHASWNLVSSLAFTSSIIHVFWRNATGSEPASYTFTTSNHISTCATVLVRGSNLASQLVSSNYAANAASTTLTGNAITSDAANQLNLWVGATDTHTAANDIVPPSALTEIIQSSNGSSSNWRTVCWGYQIKVSIGATGSTQHTGSCAVADSNATVNYMIREAVATFVNHSLLLSM